MLSPGGGQQSPGVGAGGQQNQSMESWWGAFGPATPGGTVNGVSSPSGSTRSFDKKNIVSDILNDVIFSPSATPQPTSDISPPHDHSGTTTASTSPTNTISRHARESTTPTGEASSSLSPEDHLAKYDPLATQVWKMYSKQRAELPNGQRMENLTWRMMAMTLKKKEAAEAAAAAAAAAASARALETADLESALFVAEEEEKSRLRKEKEDEGDLASFLVPEMLGSASGSGSGSQGAASLNGKETDRFGDLPVEEEARGRRGRTSRVVGFNAYAVNPE